MNIMKKYYAIFASMLLVSSAAYCDSIKSGESQLLGDWEACVVKGDNSIKLNLSFIDDGSIISQQTLFANKACEGDKKNGSPLVYGTYELGEALTTHDGNKAYALDTKLYASHGDEPLTCFGIVSVDGNKLYFGDTTRTNESGVSLDCSKPNRRPDMLHFDVAFQHID